MLGESILYFMEFFIRGADRFGKQIRNRVSKYPTQIGSVGGSKYATQGGRRGYPNTLRKGAQGVSKYASQ